MKRFFAFGCTLLLLGAGCASSTTPTTITEEVGVWEDEGEDYTVRAEYPILDGFQDQDAEERVNQELYDLALTEALWFERDVKSMEPVEELPGDGFSTLQISYRTVTATPTVVSIVFDASTYYAGAAHPNSYTKTFTYDILQIKQVDLDDIFEPDTGYRVDLWRIASEKLQKQASADDDSELAEEIAARELPDEDYFDSFTVSSEGLTVYFDPYEIGPYAWGPREVVIPWTQEIRDLLKDGSVVYTILY